MRLAFFLFSLLAATAFGPVCAEETDNLEWAESKIDEGDLSAEIVVRIEQLATKLNAAKETKPFAALLVAKLRARQATKVRLSLLLDADGAYRQLLSEDQKFRKVALFQIQSLMEANPDCKHLILLYADFAISLHELDKAIAPIQAVLSKPGKLDTPIDAIAKKASEIYTLRQEWKAAAEYPEFIALTIGINNKSVAEQWPKLKEILKVCYDQGVPVPNALQEIFGKPTIPADRR